MFEDIQEYLNHILFTYERYDFFVYQLLGIIGVFVLAGVLWYLALSRGLPKYFERNKVEEKSQKKIIRMIKQTLFLLVLMLLLIMLKFDFTLYEFEHFSLKISTIIQAVVIFKLAQLFDWIIARALISRYFDNREEIASKDAHVDAPTAADKVTANRTIQYLVYVLSIIFILKRFSIDPVLFPVKHGEVEIDFTLSKIFSAILIMLLARLVIWVSTNLVLYVYYKRSNIDAGSQYAINQLLMYVIYVSAVLMALQALEINLTLILGGAAALLVGIGLGLQQTFNDLISGIILLFDRTVEVNDVVDINGMIGTIKKIGIRASLVETRENVSVVVPNSKFISENVVNWSHFDTKVRFDVSVGVAYGTDTQVVKSILLEVAKENMYILNHPAPFVRFVGFGDSSLDFEIHFYTRNILIIEDVKSDMRFEIDRLFRENEVEIPFPQRDVWKRN